MTGTSERARIALQTSKPLPDGRLMSRMTRFGSSESKARSASARVRGLDHGVARVRQREGDERQQVRVVVDDEELHAAAAAIGSVTVKRVVPAAVRPARTSPPWRSTIDLTIQRPRPRPRGSGSLIRGAVEALEDRRALEFRRAGTGVLDPELDRRRPAAPRRSLISLSSGPYLLAFASRLVTTCVSRGASPVICGRSAGMRDAQHLAALRQQSRHQVLGILDHLRERDGLAADAELARLDAHALEQVVDEARQPQRAALQRLEQLAEPLARHRVEAVEQELDGGELRGERRAELVGDVREHGVARAAHGLELGLVAHDLHLQAAGRRRARDDDRARHAARVEVLGGLRLAVVARGVDRAGEVAGPPSVDGAAA